jgi:hypothetical protein
LKNVKVDENVTKLRACVTDVHDLLVYPQAGSERVPCVHRENRRHEYLGARAARGSRTTMWLSQWE